MQQEQLAEWGSLIRDNIPLSYRISSSSPGPQLNMFSISRSHSLHALRTSGIPLGRRAASGTLLLFILHDRGETIYILPPGYVKFNWEACEDSLARLAWVYPFSPGPYQFGITVNG